MKRIRSIIKHYIKESLDSLLVDQIASTAFGLLVTWIIGYNLQIIDNSYVLAKFLILAIVFLAFYIISTIIQLRPHRYKFRMKSIDILVEYLGDTVKVYSTYKFSTNRFRANYMYTRRSWFSDESFTLKSKTKGYKIRKIRDIGETYEYYIVFPKSQYFWETKEFQCEFTGSNKKRKFENFYWYDVICPTDKINIEVHIPKKYCTDKIELKSFLNHEDADGNEKIIKTFNGAYKWPIKPKVGWSYIFEWHWSESELALKSERG